MRHGNMHRLGPLPGRGHTTRSGAVWPVTDAVTSTTDGSRLLRIAGSAQDLSVDLLDGSAPRHLVDLGPNGSASWSANGRRVLFTRGPALSAIESMPLAGGSPTVVFRAPDGQRIADTGLQLPDGRLLTLLSDAETNVFTLWEVSIHRSSGVASGSPTRLAEWTLGGSYIGRFAVGVRAGLRLSNASSDGKRVVMKRDLSHGDVFVARFDERQGRLLDPPRRLTSDERGSYPAPGRQTVSLCLQLRAERLTRHLQAEHRRGVRGTARRRSPTSGAASHEQ